jgi:TPR repeat protein
MIESKISTRVLLVQFAVKISKSLHTTMFKFHCPHCQQKLSAEATQSGETLQCPACSVDFVIPSPTDEVVIQPQSPEASASSEAQPEQSSQTEPISESGTSHSFAERLRDGNKAAQEGATFVKKGAMVGWAGLKRRSKQAALKAQIEKLRNIDLRKALHSLGKKAFEQGVVTDGVAEQFQAIRDLDARIAEMRDKAAVDAGETKMAALKRVSKDTAKASQAQALTVKREHLMTELGRTYARKTEASPENLQDDFTTIAAIKERIHGKEEEIRALGNEGKGRIPTLAVAAVLVLLVVAGSFAGLKAIASWRDHKYDPGDSVEVLRKGAEQGHRKAQALLGDRYFNGDGVELDRADAVKWYRKAAEQGNASAQEMLGLSLEHGQGVEQDRVEALKWYREAAEQGNASAQCLLAAHYSKGEVVAKNEAEAVKWYRKSAEQGDDAAQTMLGNYYVLGRDVEQDYVEAYKWFLLAASKGHEDAKKLCEILEKKKLSPDQRAEGQRLAKTWTEKHDKE